MNIIGTIFTNATYTCDLKKGSLGTGKLFPPYLNYDISLPIKFLTRGA